MMRLVRDPLSRPNFWLAKRYARGQYDRHFLARYLANLSGMSLSYEMRAIDVIVKTQCNVGLVDMLRQMHRDDPGDTVIYAALFAEWLAARRTNAMLRSWDNEITSLDGNAEVLRHARAA